MQISKICNITNYRNLSGMKVDFHENINFIVGKNNTGKSNLLELLNILINTGKFYESDFHDVIAPIEVSFQVKYTDAEVGYFEDNFDVDDKLQITVVAKQNSVDDRIEYYHKDSETFISPKKIKGLNFIYYSSLRIPSKELNFIKNLGTGKVLNYLMKESLKKESVNDVDLLDKDKIDKVIEVLNGQIKKLNGLSTEKVEAYINNDNENLINRIVEIGDSFKRNLNDLGDGIRYGFNIFLHILELLVHLKTTTKEENFEKLMISMPDDKKYLPLILGLDEPEIHQHPYRQRALIKSVQKIINNANQEFSELLKELFGIDGFLGQVFVVTHSPNILLNEYKEIIRLYNQKGEVKAISGSNINFDPKVHKHLLRSFTYVKEAMFSESVILVEGDTEFGAVPIFASRMGHDLDEDGIGVIRLDGADSVKRCLQLYRAFKIPVNAIIDKDKEASYTGERDILFTSEIDFEEEVYSHYTLKEYMKYLMEVDKIGSLISTFKQEIDQFNVREFLENPLEYEINETIAEKIMTRINEEQLQFLKNNKTAINGALLSTYVNEIPSCFKSVIENALRGRLNE
ncbi:ATP-dependent nuclease [Paraliobacillus salinarum]|uniref:ATP-dependent nuclease n=1 Tax=Paraliobacillus salinarum TaxID=1158996 RepID=UPI0015F72FDF|nr:AAA family ATPase [Paraliobacillus salinarum]